MQHDIKRRETRQGEEKDITIQTTTSNNNETATILVTNSKELLNESNV